jgi:hypothetical protein
MSESKPVTGSAIALDANELEQRLRALRARLAELRGRL